VPFLSVPVAFTEETWVLGQELPLANVVGLSLLSLLFIGLFVYYNFYRFNFKGHVFEFIKARGLRQPRLNQNRRVSHFTAHTTLREIDLGV
jgi:hypothetical protein